MTSPLRLAAWLVVSFLVPAAAFAYAGLPDIPEDPPSSPDFTVEETVVPDETSDSGGGGGGGLGMAPVTNATNESVVANETQDQLPEDPEWAEPEQGTTADDTDPDPKRERPTINLGQDSEQDDSSALLWVGAVILIIALVVIAVTGKHHGKGLPDKLEK